MRLICCWVFLSLAATITSYSSSTSDLSLSTHGNCDAHTDACFSSKLQGKKYQYQRQFPVMKRSNEDNDPLHLDDYGPYDPSPSSKSRIHSGPIYHNTPLNPHIPRSPSSPPPLPPKRSRHTPAPSPV